MIISVNWLKKFIPNLPEIDELSRLIGARLVEIESVENLGEKYKDVIVAKVISAEKVEGSDHLNLCKIDDGGVRENVERDENGFIQIVCGAHNVRAGIFVAWLPPESIVPETFGGENFKLGARKLMGNMSNGMIASLRELSLGEDHDGILEISENVFGEKLKTGAKFADIFELNDYLLEVENKSLTHRPDCFGIIGFAREVAGILGQKFETPDWILKPQDILTDSNSQNIEINIEDSELCSRYQAIVLDVENLSKDGEMNIEKSYLIRSGMRPISTIVDVANYLMMLTGQPLHTFDFGKLLQISGSENAKITVRGGTGEEKLELLDEREITLENGDIVIAAGKNGEIPIALAGAMGGKSTDIDENTKRILVESATFNLYNLRNTQMRHGIFSEAITRFTKGQPAGMTEPVLAKTVCELEKQGAKAITNVAENYPGNHESSEVEVDEVKVNQILGTNFSREEIIKTLENVGFSIEISGEDKIIVSAPFWRTDIHIFEDVAEEIGRLNGYDNVDLVLAKRTFKPVDFSNFDKMQHRMRGVLVSAGANEILTYTFIHGDLLKTVGQNPDNSYKIINSISPDLQYYRQSLTPSLLSKVNQNIRAGFNEFAIFEINKISIKKDLTDGNVPPEIKNLAFTYANKKGENAYFEAKKYVEFLFEKLNLEIEFSKANAEFMNKPENLAFEPKRSAQISLISEDGEKISIGIVGEYKKSVVKSFKLPESSAGFELVEIEKIEKIWVSSKPKFETISRFQFVERDVSLKVQSDFEYAQIMQEFLKNIPTNEDLKFKISPIDIYKNDENFKTITLRFRIIPMTKTLSGNEIKEIMSEIEKIVSEKINAEII